VIGIPVPFEIQRASWEKAWTLRTDFADRMDIFQNVRMEVLLRMEPERLGWSECGDSMCLWTLCVEVRV
jgi:hypothetical protein